MLFLGAVEGAFNSFEQDRYLLERSLEISSKEMQERLHQNIAMSAQLAQASKLASVGTLASGIAHELNNPLTGIQGYTELMLLTPDRSDKDQAFLEKTKKLCARMGKTINQLRKLARDSSLDERKSFSLMEPISDTIELLGAQVASRGLELIVRNACSPEQLTMHGDPIQMVSVFQNLITNSCDAFGEKDIRTGGKIELMISIVQGSDDIKVVYRDNAGGIPKKILAKVFDPFFTTKPVGAGTGLGLSICRQTVLDHQGHIQLDVEEGVGTMFTIMLPRFEGSKVVVSIAQITKKAS